VRRRAFLLLALLGGAARAGRIAVISVRNRPAVELARMIRPLLNPGDALNVAGNALILRTDPDTARQVEELVRRLDRPAADLLITVRRVLRGRHSTRAARGGVNVCCGDFRLQASVPMDEGAAVQAWGHEHTVETAREQPVRTMEGSPVLLRGAGELEATAHLVGDGGVQLTIRSLGRHGEAGMDTVVSGRLGQWITLGGITEHETDTSTGILTGSRHAAAREEIIQVRVDRASP